MIWVTLRENHKLIMIFILHFKTWENVIFYFFKENMLEKLIGFDRMHENKIAFFFKGN